MKNLIGIIIIGAVAIGGWVWYSNHQAENARIEAETRLKIEKEAKERAEIERKAAEERRIAEEKNKAENEKRMAKTAEERRLRDEENAKRRAESDARQELNRQINRCRQNIAQLSHKWDTNVKREIIELENIRKRVNAGQFNATTGIENRGDSRIELRPVRLENQGVIPEIASKAKALRAERAQVLAEINKLSEEQESTSRQIGSSGFYGGSVKGDKVRRLGKKIETLNYKLNGLMRDYEQLKDQFGQAVNGKIRAFQNCELAKEIVAEKTKLNELEKQLQEIGQTILAEKRPQEIAKNKQ